MTSLLYSIILGIVQGVSEWLPVSSKTQVLLVSILLFSLNPSIAYVLGLFMEMGSLFSAIIYFRKDVVRVFRQRELLKFILIITLFTGVVGVPLYIISDKVLQDVYSPWVPSLFLGFALILDSLYIRFARITPRIQGLRDLSLRDMVIIGIAQGIAALPGVSRSGMTVSTMLIMGVKGEDAFRLSYLAYIPASMGAVGVTLLLGKHQLADALSTIDPLGIVLATVTSTLTGLLVIGILLNVAKKTKIYLLTGGLGVVTVALGVVAAIVLG